MIKGKWDVIEKILGNVGWQINIPHTKYRATPKSMTTFNIFANFYARTFSMHGLFVLFILLTKRQEFEMSSKQVKES